MYDMSFYFENTVLLARLSLNFVTAFSFVARFYLLRKYEFINVCVDFGDVHTRVLSFLMNVVRANQVTRFTTRPRVSKACSYELFVALIVISRCQLFSENISYL